MEKEVTGAIYLQEVSFPGLSRQGENLSFFLITGLAKAGLEEVGPVVEQLRKFTEDFAEKNGIDVVLIDTAAGTHCPVLHALLGAEKAYVVTEATPMGAHDLDLILEVNRKLKIPSSVILNQANLGNKQGVEKIIEKHQVPLIKEIPFSKPLLTAYSQGKLLEANLSLADF